MKLLFKSLLTIALCALPFIALSARAAITCVVSPSGFSTTYGPTFPGWNSTQSSVTATCTRNLAGDPASITYTLRSNNGGVTSGGFNLANSGANTIRYDTYKDSTCATKWGATAATQFTGTLTFGAAPSTVAVTHQYWGCLPALQVPVAGTYTDLLTATLNPSSGATVTQTYTASILTPGTCSLSTAPGTVAFTYTALGAAASASTTFGVNCTNRLPYTIALDAVNGVVSGLHYTLALSTSSSRGLGVEQTHTISGNMVAGQAGTCPSGSCSATNLHSVTITY